ncbi:unnamed protein product [Brassica oleracea]
MLKRVIFDYLVSSLSLLCRSDSRVAFEFPSSSYRSRNRRLPIHSY